MLPSTTVNSLAQGNGALSSRDAARHTAGAKRYKYLRRLFRFRQMDFEFAAWQMLYLFTSPQRVYRNFHYRKQTKDQWARDDPAFLVLLSIWLCVCSQIGSQVSILSKQFISNKYLVKRQSRDYDVEWGYAFDVHLNAFYPLLIILHFIQLFFINPLPFLKNTVILLYPFAPLILLYGLSLALGWNFTRALCSFYKYRVR
ncbi:Protein unc-50-like protein [Camelus dromedarius]|uniref:Protein unc-50-like protein n=1 Tax=Camelus dromedarius TaxID=9838 RepID=A0A5N4CCU5_CAMDR|nr:Protein unc-50-like protein [Camelus dromedarius]